VTQNIYDNAGFFAGYSRLRRSVDGLDGAPEWPTLKSMLPDLAGKRVVDLGCGFGWFCRFAREAGAAEVLGFDVSANMLARARGTTADPAISYCQADLETLALPANAFDLAYSALVVHYLADLEGFARAVHDALRPGGRLVLTTEHPMFMASTLADFVDVDGVRTWPVDHYADEGERTTNWLVPGVRKWFRSAGTTVNALIDAGFVIRRLIDWTPSTEQVTAAPELAKERDRPAFLLIAADRPPG